MGSDDLTWTPLGGDVEVGYISPTGPTTETLFGASAFEVPGGDTTTTGAVVIVLDDGTVGTLTDLLSPFRSGTATLADLKTLTNGRNHTVRITDNGVSAAAEKIAAALAETLSAVGPGGSKEVSKFFGIDSDSGNPIMVCPGSPLGLGHHGYQSLVDKVNEAAASIHQENGGPPVTVAVSQHGGSTKEPTRGTAYTVFTFDVAPRAHWCVYARYGDSMSPPRKEKESKTGHVVVGENLATGLEEVMKRVRGWIASTMCEAVGAWPLPLMTKFEQKPDLRGIVWSEPGDTVTFLGSAGEKTFTVSGRARVRGVAVPGLAKKKVAAGIEKCRIKTIKKRPADDDGAVAPLLKEGQGGTKRQRTRDSTIVDDCGGVRSTTTPRSKIDKVIDDIRTTTIPGIEASIARLEGLLLGTTMVDTINGNSLEDMIALRREELTEFNNIIAGLENRKREIETIEREERELRRRYEELCRRGGEEA